MKQMKPEEKAKELFLKHSYETHSHNAKMSALVTVSEIHEFMRMDDEYNKDAHMANTHWPRYWKKVEEHLKTMP